MAAKVSDSSKSDRTPTVAFPRGGARNLLFQSDHEAVGVNSKGSNDNQKLGALKILLEVVIHSGLFALRGGLRAVHLCFVISGYLTNKHLPQSTLPGRLSSSPFYAKRLGRTLPDDVSVAQLRSTRAIILLLPSMKIPRYSLTLPWTVIYVPKPDFALQQADHY